MLIKGASEQIYTPLPQSENGSSLVQIMGWRWFCANPLSKPMMAYRHWHKNADTIQCSDSCSQAIGGEGIENPFICHIMTPLLSDKGTCVRFCWKPSHCGIEGMKELTSWRKRPLTMTFRPFVECPPCKFEGTGQLLWPAAGSNPSEMWLHRADISIFWNKH